MPDVNAKRREVSCCILIDRNGDFLLQQRDDIPTIVQPGKIATFGGHRELGESFIDCVIREIHEETGLLLAPNRLETVLVYEGEDVEGPGAGVTAAFYAARDIPGERLVITEGALVRVPVDRLPSLGDKLTPLTRLALAEFLKQPAKS